MQNSLYLDCRKWKVTWRAITESRNNAVSKAWWTRNVGQCPTWWPPCRI